MKKLFLFIFFIKSYLLFSIENENNNNWSGNFDLGFNFTKNSESTLQLNNVFLINYKFKSSIFYFKNNISFISKTGEKELLNKGEQEFTYSLNNKNINGNLSVINLYDLTRSIKNRFSSGIGISYRLLNTKNENFDIGVSILRENQLLTIGEKQVNNRISNEMNYQIHINNNIEIITENKYQPSIKKIGDFRWKTNLKLRVHISSNFLLSIITTFNYDSFPELDIPESDYQIIKSLSYTF